MCAFLQGKAHTLRRLAGNPAALLMNNGGFRSSWVLVERTAGPSTPLRYGRDDKFIAPERLNCRFLGFARNDKGEDGALLKFGGPTNYPNGCRSFLPQLAAGSQLLGMTKGRAAFPFGVMAAMATSQSLFIPHST